MKKVMAALFAVALATAAPAGANGYGMPGDESPIAYHREMYEAGWEVTLAQARHIAEGVCALRADASEEELIRRYQVEQGKNPRQAAAIVPGAEYHWCPERYPWSTEGGH